MAKGSQGLTWLQMGLGPEHRVCSGCGKPLKLADVWHWNGTDRTVFGTCCPAFSFAVDSSVTSRKGTAGGLEPLLTAYPQSDPGDEDDGQ